MVRRKIQKSRYSILHHFLFSRLFRHFVSRISEYVQKVLANQFFFNRKRSAIYLYFFKARIFTSLFMKQFPRYIRLSPRSATIYSVNIAIANIAQNCNHCEITIFIEVARVSKILSKDKSEILLAVHRNLSSFTKHTIVRVL